MLRLADDDECDRISVGEGDNLPDSPAALDDEALLPMVANERGTASGNLTVGILPVPPADCKHLISLLDVNDGTEVATSDAHSLLMRLALHGPPPKKGGIHMTKKTRLFAAGVSLACFSMAADAALINFDSHASTTLISGTPPAAAVVTNDYASLGVVFGRAGSSAGIAVVNNTNTFSAPNGACGLNAAGDIVAFCAGDIYFNFVDPADGVTAATTNSLSFVIGDDGGDLDSWLISVYGIGDALLEARAVSSNANIAESFNYAQMARVHIQWTAGTDAGYLLDNMEFAAPTAAAPEPTTLALLGLGLAGLAATRRRKQ